MKLAFTGAGGGHFTPLIAVAESIKKTAFEKGIESPELFFFSDKEYDIEALNVNNMHYVHIPSGKMHVYFSFDTIKNIFIMCWGVLVALQKMYVIFPDVIFAKGGYASFPVLCAARFFSIPVIVHESDMVPGRVTLWTASFAERVAISYEEVRGRFKNPYIALTGIPLREKVIPKIRVHKGIRERERPVLLIIGGSQGSKKINEIVLSILPQLLEKYDIIHQTGISNKEEVLGVSSHMIKDSPHFSRYFCEGVLDVSLFYDKVDIVLTRAGSTTLFETALWHIPQIIVPIPEAISRDQKSNAYAFAKKGTGIVIEENNLTPHLLLSQIEMIIENKETYTNMSEAGEGVSFTKNAAKSIAEEMLAMAEKHYQ